MNIERIEELGDPRLDVYRDIRRTNRTRWSPHFIGEGQLVVERLLASRFDVLSVLVSEKRLESFVEQRPGGFPRDLPVLVVPQSLCCELVGFDFHRGVMACGIRDPLRRVPDLPHPGRGPQLIVACPHTSLPDNLGSIIRLAASFRALGILVGPRSADPFSRRVLRVSMGNAFQLPIVEPLDWESELTRLRDQLGFEIVATARGPESVGLSSFTPEPRTILLLGNEATGLTADDLAMAQRQVAIEMSDDVDSLNVATAAGIFLYEWSRNRR